MEKTRNYNQPCSKPYQLLLFIYRSNVCARLKSEIEPIPLSSSSSSDSERDLREIRKLVSRLQVGNREL